MQINMASSEALDIIDRKYGGLSKPLSVDRTQKKTQSEEWWISGDKSESITQDRKCAGIYLYLHIASHAANELPSATFPAAFSFTDRARYRPDKGLVKALLKAQVLETCRCERELCFMLNARGLSFFGGR